MGAEGAGAGSEGPQDHQGVIVCTGPESSGTRLLTWIVRNNLSLEADHLSMPEGPPHDDAPKVDEWWNWEEVAAQWEDMTGEPTRFVGILRRPNLAGLSAVRRGIVADLDAHRLEWLKAMEMLTAIPDIYWVSYAGLIANPAYEIGYLARRLHATPRWPARVVDANQKWLEILANA